MKPKRTRGVIACTLLVAIALAGIRLWSVRATLPSAASLSSNMQGSPEAPYDFTVRPSPLGAIRYFAVGDSYTYGEGTQDPERECWPVILTADLQRRGLNIALIANTGVDGYTAQDALDTELPIFRGARPDFATLMIGVNDTYRGTAPAEFRAEVHTLITSMQSALSDKRRLIVVTIPDYAETPAGARFAAATDGAARTVLFNRILRDEAHRTGATLVDLYPLSVKLGLVSGMLAPDNLHPSESQYFLWADRITPAAYGLLDRSSATPTKPFERRIDQ